jgi:serine/threonine-protein kinase RsbW
MDIQLLSLVVPAKPDYLAMIRLTVAAIAKDAGFSDDSIADLKVAISEAASNVIRHAYNQDTPAEDCIIEIACSRRRSCLAIEVIDHGCGMTVPPPPSEGLGFGIIGSLMDKVDVETGEGGTTVCMEKEPVSTRS